LFHFILQDRDGAPARIHHAFSAASREQAGREASPSAAIIDSQSAKAAEKALDPRGFDSGKKITGRKHQILVVGDTDCWILRSSSAAMRIISSSCPRGGLSSARSHDSAAPAVWRVISSAMPESSALPMIRIMLRPLDQTKSLLMTLKFWDRLLHKQENDCQTVDKLMITQTCGIT
jgi:hypothetical protein